MIIYDCEIIKAIQGKDETRIEGIEYCEGWKDHSNMGISIIGAYDYETFRYRVFAADNFKEFQELVDSTDLVIGFNSLAFDNRLCAAHGITVRDDKSYDLLVEIWKGAGLSGEFKYPSHVGFGLDACVRTNFNLSKTGDGALAPVDWQRGKFGKVVDYCLNDVHLTKALIDLVVVLDGIKDPRGGKENIPVDGSRLRK